MSKEKKLSKVLDEIWRFYEFDKQALICFFRSGYKYFDRKAKEKEAEEMEKDLNVKREAVEQIKSLIGSKGKELSEAEMEEFVEKHYEKISQAIGKSAFTLPIRLLYEMLKEYRELLRR